MEFKLLGSAIKKQIKSSMTRIIQNLIKLNINDISRINSDIAFDIWSHRYISKLKEGLYYNFILVDDRLLSDLKEVISIIYTRELDKLSLKSLKNSQNDNSIKPRLYKEAPATQKQLNYASYLMNMLKNKPLPKRNYTMSEISFIIDSLKRNLKV